MQLAQPRRQAQRSSKVSALPSGLPGVHAFVQPILNLATGRVVGFEALARFRKGTALLAPAQILPGLSEAQRVALFTAMVGQAVGFIRDARRRDPELTVSVNVETSLLMRDDFCELVRVALGDSVGDASALTVELLEGEPVVDFDRALATMAQLKRMGVGIALDDAGSAYSSLLMIKQLPIDVIKLDQAFARGLRRRPDDLQFVNSMASLARGLGKRLVVEGVETDDIQDALAMLGVQYGQGYAIARPMPAEHACDWLGAHRATPRGRTPQTLLGAFAVHLTIVETCRVMKDQALPIGWREQAKNPHACEIGRYFDRYDLHGTPYGLAHQRFHAVIDQLETDEESWKASAERFRHELRDAVVAELDDRETGQRLAATGGAAKGSACACHLHACHCPS